MDERSRRKTRPTPLSRSAAARNDKLTSKWTGLKIRAKNHLVLKTEKRIWPGTESNCRHEDFQSSALPTELPGRTEGFSCLDNDSCEPQWLSISNIRRQRAATRALAYLNNPPSCRLRTKPLRATWPQVIRVFRRADYFDGQRLAFRGAVWRPCHGISGLNSFRRHLLGEVEVFSSQ